MSLMLFTLHKLDFDKINYQSTQEKINSIIASKTISRNLASFLKLKIDFELAQNL